MVSSDGGVVSSDGFAQVQVVYMHLYGCPMLVSDPSPTLSVIVSVRCDSCEVEIVGWVGGV